MLEIKMIEIDKNKICYIFDVDGTLTEPRKYMNTSFINEFRLWSKDKQCIIATGSDFSKTKEQIPSDVLSVFKYSFCCMANEVRNNNGTIIYKSEFEVSQELEDCLQYFLQNSNFEYRCGRHLEFRTGMLNFSIVGRNASMNQRDEYNQWDKIHGERDKIANFINKQFPTLEATVGGSISIDIIEQGQDKGQVINYLDNAGATKVVFVGDRCFPGGKDWGIVRELQKTDIAFEWYNVDSPEDTLRLIRLNEVFGGGK